MEDAIYLKPYAVTALPRTHNQPVLQHQEKEKQQTWSVPVSCRYFGASWRCCWIDGVFGGHMYKVFFTNTNFRSVIALNLWTGTTMTFRASRMLEMELVNPESYLADLCSLSFLVQGHFLFLCFLNSSGSFLYLLMCSWISQGQMIGHAYYGISLHTIMCMSTTLPECEVWRMNIAVVAWDPRL